MSDYTKATDFAAKDALLTGNPAKLVKGTELDTEFNNISTAVATKYDSADLGVTLQQYDADLAAIAALAKTDGNIIVGDGATWVAESGATARTSLGAAALAANTFTGLQTFAAGADIASATTVDLTAATGNLVRITGTTATTGVTINNGQVVLCYPTGAWPLTYNATTMPIKGGASYTCAAGDTVIFSKDGNGTLHVDIVPVALHPAIVSQAAAEAGTDTTARLWTAERVGQAIAALGGSGITLGTPVASTSGTSIDFTSIPSGTKRITINFAGVSGNGTSNLLVQIGDSGGIENTGYSSGATNDNGTRVTNTAGFVILSANAAGSLFSGRVTLELLEAANFTWVSAGQLCDTGSGMDGESGGSKSLSAELDRVRITTVGGTDAFDAGKINITYE